MTRDYRGKEAANTHAIVETDKRDVMQSDVLLVAADTPSWGTAMEILLAAQYGKIIVARCLSETPSPWLIYHTSKIFQTWEDCFAFLKTV